MAKITKQGHITGKLDNRIYYVVNGKQHVRSVPKEIKTTPSKKQEAAQMKMALIAPVARSFNQLIKVTYRSGSRLSPYNQMVANLFSSPITGAQESPRIDYSKVMVSIGKLLQPVGASATSIGSTIQFTWKNYHRFFCLNRNDQAVLVAYCEELQQCISITQATSRITGEAVLDVPAFKGYSVHTWLGFVSLDGKSAATSVYTGRVPIT